MAEKESIQDLLGGSLESAELEDDSGAVKYLARPARDTFGRLNLSRMSARRQYAWLEYWAMYTEDGDDAGLQALELELVASSSIDGRRTEEVIELGRGREELSKSKGMLRRLMERMGRE